jgi:hypothetical protein
VGINLAIAIIPKNKVPCEEHIANVTKYSSPEGKISIRNMFYLYSTLTECVGYVESIGETSTA